MTSQGGRFISSTYYMPALPSWVVKFNQGSPAKNYCGKKWAASAGEPGGTGKTFSEFKRLRMSHVLTRNF